jgi:acyl carrier protein
MPAPVQRQTIDRRSWTEIAPDVDPAEIDPERKLAEQLEIDSMDFLKIGVAVHEQTGIEIPERDYEKLSTLEDAVAYLLAARPGSPGMDA